MKKLKRHITILFLLALNLATTACGSVDSHMSDFYNVSGDHFALPGGYNRTIFSTNNF